MGGAADDSGFRFDKRIAMKSIPAAEGNRGAELLRNIDRLAGHQAICGISHDVPPAAGT